MDLGLPQVQVLVGSLPGGCAAEPEARGPQHHQKAEGLESEAQHFLLPGRILGTQPARERLVVGSCPSPTPRRRGPDSTCAGKALQRATSSLFSMAGPSEERGGIWI